MAGIETAVEAARRYIIKRPRLTRLLDKANARVLMLIGPQVIFGLAIAIFLGVVIGTYSSIYISSPALVWMGLKPDSFIKAEADEDVTVAKPV